MAWQTEMVRYLRYCVFDLDPNSPTYSDQRLQELLVWSAQLVEQELDFSQQFVADQDGLTITPDPTDRVGPPPTRDDSFVNLVVMKAACVVDRGEVRAAIGQAIRVRDGTSSIDLRGVMEGKLKLLLKGGWCAAFDDAKVQYLLNKSHIAGAAIMSPFRVWAGDGRSIWPNAGFLDFRP